MKPIEARYEEGMLKPTAPLSLRSGERVALIVVRLPDPGRWNMTRLAKSATNEDVSLTEAGLADWSRALDAEDRR